MTVLIGIDEAGYGPNLGPLVISATRWRVGGADAQLDLDSRLDLYSRLGDTVTRSPASDDPRLAICDSKRLYTGGGCLDRLELGLLAALSVTPVGRPRSWRQVWSALGADAGGRRQRIPWYRDYNCSLPTAITTAALDAACGRLADGLAGNNVELLRVRSVAVLPSEFNGLVERFGSKGQALSSVSLSLLAETLASESDQEPAMVVCDKHGGRNRYGPLLQAAFPEPLIETRTEGRARSVYRWGPPGARVEVCFQTGGEAFLPTALASMASKYLRELAMRAFNDYWQRHVPGLRPTAGYPVDAKRFRHDIATQQQRLGIDDRTLWRHR